jgi:hypothetical protein
MEHVVYIHMCTNAVADSVMLYLQHDFYKITFKIKHKLHIASGSVLLPRKNSGCAPVYDDTTDDLCFLLSN